MPVPEVDSLSIYVCGITPYDSMHVGHIAMLLTYDVLVRRLRSTGSPARMVRNITDIDDPLLPKAQELGIPYWDLVEREIGQFNQDERALELVPAAVEPRASRHVDQIARTIERLLSEGYAYALGEHIYFAVDSDTEFGSMSGYDREEMIKLARDNGGDPDRPGKRNPLDFILWQPARKGEPEYSSSLGPGRPGWHIGCSVMSRQHVGERIDIHGGGQDLVFPHHECEMAQNRRLPSGSRVAIWAHAGLVWYRGHKMSKSLGNIVLARDVLRDYDPRVLRLAVLSHYHHRYDAEWRDEFLDEAAELLGRLVAAATVERGADLTDLVRQFHEYIDDDLDFPGAVRVLSRCMDILRAGGEYPDTAAAVISMASLLGVDVRRPVTGRSA